MLRGRWTSFYLVLFAVAATGTWAIWLGRARHGDREPPIGEVSVASSPLTWSGYVVGSDSAPVEVVEYSDFQCPFCARFAVLSMPDVRRRLVDSGYVRWRFLDLPLPFHTEALPAHQAAACAADQNKFWEMHDALFFRQREWAGSSRARRHFRRYAAALGLDLRQYDACMDDERHAARIEATRDRALAAGIRGAPTFLIGGLLVSGAIPYDSLRTLVDAVAANER